MEGVLAGSASSSSAAVENKHVIIPFCGTGFDNWKFRLTSVLKALELKDALKEVPVSGRNEAWQKMNNKACMLIIQSVSDIHLEYIKDYDVVFEMISKLEGIFDKKGVCSKFYFLKELISIKYNGSMDLQEHFARCDRIFRELKNLGSSFDESDMACFLLLSMPTEFVNVVTAIRTVSENDLKMEFVKSGLLEFSLNKNQSKNLKNVRDVPASFSAAPRQIKSFKCNNIGHVQSVCDVKCHTCGKFRHNASQCRKHPANYADGHS